MHRVFTLIPGTTLSQVLASPSDLLGNTLLGIHGAPPRDEPTYDEVRAQAPPLRLFQNTYLWTGSRGSSVDTAFDGTTAWAHHPNDVITTIPHGRRQPG